MAGLIAELKKRKVFRVAAVYAVVAWLLIQVADVVLPALQLPEWTVTFITVLLILGFPIALILAWAYEVTPGGIRPDSAGNNTVPAAAPPNQTLLYATFALVLLVASFQIADRFFSAEPEVTLITSNISPSIVDIRATRLAVQLPEAEFFHVSRGDFDLSRDGNLFVYRGSDANGDPILWARNWDSPQGRPLPNTSDPYRPRISPDGTEILFSGADVIRIYSLTNDQVRTLEAGDAYTYGIAVWSDDGDWVYFSNATGGISRLPAVGGPVETVVESDAESEGDFIDFLEVLPQGNLLFSVFAADGSTQIRALDAESGLLKDLFAGSFPRYVPSGHLLYQVQEDAQLRAVPFDAQALEVLGPTTQIDNNLLLVGAGIVGNVGVSHTGRLIYRKGSNAGRLATPAWVDRDGRSIDIDPNWKMVSELGRGVPSLSSDDNAIAVAIGTIGNYADIWVNRLNGPMTRITFGQQRRYLPIWSADGESVFYINGEYGRSISFNRADGSGSPQLVLESDFELRGMDLSRDGRWLIFRDYPSGPDSGRLLAKELNVSSEPASLIETVYENSSPALSPDGRWLAYVSDESGQREIYVQPFPQTDAGRWQVSVNGGTEPRWSHSGNELFYRNNNQEMVAVAVSGGTAFQWLEETVLFDASAFRSSPDVATYSVSSDDQRFLMMRMDEVVDTQLILVDNWMAMLQ